jgi:hypothetical protein
MGISASNLFGVSLTFATVTQAGIIYKISFF